MIRARYIVALLLVLVVVGLLVWVRAFFFGVTEQVNVDLGRVVEVEKRGDVEVVAQGLEIPWEIAWLPSGEMLVTERPGRLLKIGESRTVIPIAGVAHVGEGGLMGMALHPNFKDNQWIYLYLTTRADGKLKNRVERYRLQGEQLFDRQIIIDEIPGSRFHDGGRIGFGPDGYLYVAVGDAGDEDEAQSSLSLNGTILRMADDGSVPADNPFGSLVYSYGHRNVQGLAWDDVGRLWATEHGRSGIKTGLDEINLIEPGKNYGWPLVEGDEKSSQMEAPAAHSSAQVTWAPAGMVWLDGSLYFTGLRGESLYEAKIDGSSVISIVPHFHEQFGRLRVVKIGPDGWLYVATSNRDGRGEAGEGDDKIIRIRPR